MGIEELHGADGTGPRVANRRDVLLGATGIAVAAATSTVLGAGVANAAPAAGARSMTIAGLGAFEVLAFSWGASNSGSLHQGGGGSAGKANFQDVSLTRYTDAFTPDLVAAVATGNTFDSATLTFTPRGGRTPLVLTMTQVLVTSLSLGGSSGERQELTENLSLNFAKLTVSYGQESTDVNVAGL
jgi:type VI secretion system secreted protein Hcp